MSTTHGLDASQNYVGTCQACFQAIAVSGKSASIYLHGYRRPGDGNAHGRCLGTDAAAFEISKGLTEALRDALVKSIAGLNKILAELKAGPEELTVQVPDFDKPVRVEGYRRIQPTKHVTIRPGEQTEQEYWNGKAFRFITFQQHLDAQISKIAGEIRNDEMQLDFINKKLQGWTYCPETMPTKDKADLELARAQRATLDARKAERQAKNEEKAQRDQARLDSATAKVHALLAQPTFIAYLEATKGYGRGDTMLAVAWWDIEYRTDPRNNRDFADRIRHAQSLASDLKRYAKDARAAGYKVKG